MAGRTAFYGGMVLDGLVFHIDAAKQESYSKDGMRYIQNGSNSALTDFADTSIRPSAMNSIGTISGGATFSNFAPYHLSEYSTPYWHNPVSNSGNGAGAGTFYGNIEFDGVDDYISFPSSPEMNSNDMTVSAWFYVNNFKSGAVPTGGTLSMVVSRYSNITGSNGWELFYGNDGVIYFGGRENGSLYISTTASLLLKSATKAPGLTANGGWYNVVGTKSGSTWKIYAAETNKYVKYNGGSQDLGIYTYPYKQALSGSTTAGTGAIPFAQNNLFIGKAANSQFHMDGRIMSVSIYNRALSLEEINKNYDSFSKRAIRSEFDRGLNNGNVLITYDTLENSDIAEALSNISAREAALGKTVTVIEGYANLPSDLSMYSHIWDIDYDTNQLVALNSSKYTAYLQGGGALFLIGENSGFPQRNNTLATFITSVGGGTISFDGSFPVLFTDCIMENQFLLENSNNSVKFPAIGRFSSIGTGTNIVYTNAVYSSYPIGTQGLVVVWKTGSLANAPKGAIVSVLDINIWQTAWAEAPYNGSDFIKNASLILDRF